MITCDYILIFICIVISILLLFNRWFIIHNFIKYLDNYIIYSILNIFSKYLQYHQYRLVEILFVSMKHKLTIHFYLYMMYQFQSSYIEISNIFHLISYHRNIIARKSLYRYSKTNLRQKSKIHTHYCNIFGWVTQNPFINFLTFKMKSKYNFTYFLVY